MKTFYQLKYLVIYILFISVIIFMGYACENSSAYESSNQNEMTTGCQNEGEEVCDAICVNTLTDRLNCGQCGQICPDGLVCQQGSCKNSCPNDGEEICTGECVNFNNNDFHCGACNRECAGGSRCIAGACACDVGLSLCLDQCVNLQNDPLHCGECSAPCRAGLQCVAGECKAERIELCNGEDDDLDTHVDENDDGTPLKIDCGNLCGPGEQICQQGEFTQCTAPKGTEELCDMQDNDCDGLVDEEISLTYYVDTDGDGFGSNDVTRAVVSCNGVPESPDPTIQYVLSNQDCNDQNDQVYPNAPEGCNDRGDECQNCDQIDNNCDGSIDEGCTCTLDSPPQECGSDVGICQPGERACVNGILGECEGVGYRSPELEVCNLLDDDCDESVDEGMPDDVFEVLEARMSNDRCDVAHQLATSISGEGPIVIANANLNHSSNSIDRDWYVLQSTDNVNVCLPFISGQCVTMELKFTHPAGVNPGDYEVCVHQIERIRNACEDVSDVPVRCISQNEFSTYDVSRRTYTIPIQWQGQCGSDDSRYFAVEVFSPNDINSCDTYDLSINTTLENSDCPVEEEEE